MSFTASDLVILSSGRNVLFGAIYPAASIHSIYLHPQSAETSLNFFSHFSPGLTQASFAIIFATSFRLMVLSTLYSLSIVTEAMIHLLERYFAASVSLLLLEADTIITELREKHIHSKRDIRFIRYV